MNVVQSIKKIALTLSLATLLSSTGCASTDQNAPSSYQSQSSSYQSNTNQIATGALFGILIGSLFFIISAVPDDEVWIVTRNGKRPRNLDQKSVFQTFLDIFGDGRVLHSGLHVFLPVIDQVIYSVPTTPQKITLFTDEPNELDLKNDEVIGVVIYAFATVTEPLAAIYQSPEGNWQRRVEELLDGAVRSVFSSLEFSEVNSLKGKSLKNLLFGDYFDPEVYRILLDQSRQQAKDRFKAKNPSNIAGQTAENIFEDKVGEWDPHGVVRGLLHLGVELTQYDVHFTDIKRSPELVKQLEHLNLKLAQANNEKAEALVRLEITETQGEIKKRQARKIGEALREQADAVGTTVEYVIQNLENFPKLVEALGSANVNIITGAGHSTGLAELLALSSISHPPANPPQNSNPPTPPPAPGTPPSP